MSVATATYKVGDTYTTQKSKVSGIITEITPQANGNVRVKLDVNGKPRYPCRSIMEQHLISLVEN